MYSDQKSVEVDASITSADILYGETALIGSRVKHYGQRYTGCATATVIGFRYAEPSEGYRPRDWVKVMVEHDDPVTVYNFDAGWDWDRTELAPDL